MELEEEKDSIYIDGEEKLKEYYSLLEQWKDLRSTIRDIVFAPKYSLPFLQPGRIVRILGLPAEGDDEETLLTMEEKGFWGVVVNFEKIQSAGKDFEEGGQHSQPHWFCTFSKSSFLEFSPWSFLIMRRIFNLLNITWDLRMFRVGP